MIYLYNTTAIDINRHLTIFPITYTAIQTMLNKRNDYAKLYMISCELETRLLAADQVNALSAYLAINATHCSSIPAILQSIYQTLSVIHFYVITQNDAQETSVMQDSVDRAEIKVYLLRQGKSVVEACALVDINMARNFLRADVVAFEDYQKFQGDYLKLAMESKLRNEGRKYLINDGDIVQFFENNTKYRKL